MKNDTISEDFLSPYSHINKEVKIYEKWENEGFFKQKKRHNKDNFTIVMPPPNSNGPLHVGHGLFVTLQDIMVRYNRMLGKSTLWLPGADHAGFETQIVYEKKLSKEGKSRFDIEPSQLYKDIFEFTKINRVKMENQLRQLGASCDWTKNTFTLDKKVKKQVYATFKKLEDDGLLYRNLRTVSWCPKHQTSFSDLELNYVERNDPFYYFKYGPFVIGTVRPETKFADKYIVIHPDDERYKEYKHMQKLTVEWINGPIEATIIKDEASIREMGSGVMTITPAHSQIDWEIAQKYNLDYDKIIDEKGKLLPISGEFVGMKITDAREKIVEKLKSKNLIVKIDNEYIHSVPVCYKCNREIEPQLKKQWFIKMKPLAKNAIKSIEKNQTQFITDKYKKIALDWLNNIRDWNISRQITWGIDIPAKICNDCDHAFVDLENKIDKCSKCGSEKVVKDTDTFDTWFSSSQWPFITLNYPEGSDYKKRYPTTIMETGHDILFFWVIRMIIMGIYVTGKVPFEYIYLHGIVKDKKGEKMSKSKGNVINPIDVSNEFGTDALRMAYVVGNVPGENVTFSLEKVRAYKKFANKLWNIGRFVLTECINFKEDERYTKEDKKIKENFDNLFKDVTCDMDNYNFHLASEKIYHYVWHTFADKILEESKSIFKSEFANSRKKLLVYIFTNILKILHPFMPFITEEIWSHIPKSKYKKEKYIIIESWPIKNKSFIRKMFDI